MPQILVLLLVSFAICNNLESQLPLLREISGEFELFDELLQLGKLFYFINFENQLFYSFFTYEHYFSIRLSIIMFSTIQQTYLLSFIRMSQRIFSKQQWRSQGESLPPKLEKCCRKMMLFPKALFLATTFPKIVKNSIFLLNFYQKFSKITQNFQKFVCFRPNARKFNAPLIKILKILKIC